MSLTYTIRESRKAKHVSLKLSSLGNLEVIVPFGFDQRDIPAILQKKQHWIDRATERIKAQVQHSDTAAERPEQICLRAIGEAWQVEYCPTTWHGVKLTASPFRLVLSGQVANPSLCQATLQQWVAHKAGLHLISWLQSVSQELALPFERASVRQQKTIWGSCSAKKTISLNSKLLFLSPPIVRYVLIHELCHTVHLNHSPAYWELVGRYEPQYRQLDASLQNARYEIPWWMER
ncbi:M48 family metallopeptidase [Leptolyngbya sp. FACHB-36]|uniref:M48 family metallopeptidase n=1 Tax=Leptolyngbya sp. FACHB-36 TaxID=2692808 RepID=UPI001681019A|nr:SprT family zinc-dependent metalloprotease [Leptolyngbya sp. FACHB-36]MBD2022688.1 M48 family metallopeptidase [Leptolyngbya sp. FACHB-36]